MQVCTVVRGKTAWMGVRDPLQPVDHGEEDILDAAVVQFVHHPQPELGALVLFQP